MLKTLYAFALLILPFAARAQFGLPQGFDVKTFQKDEETVFWLLNYDSAMIKAPVPAMQIDAPFDDLAFAYQDKKSNWHVLHGKLDSGRYRIAAHFLLDAKGRMQSAKEKTDTAMLSSAGRALRNAHHEMRKSLPDDWQKMNRYIRRNADNSWTVWFLPEYSEGAYAIYGAELTYYYNAAGTQLMTSKRYLKTLQHEKPDADKDVVIDYSTEKMPTLGAMYFAHSFKSKFKSVGIRYKKGTSTVTYTPAERTYAWQHAAD